MLNPTWYYLVSVARMMWNVAQWAYHGDHVAIRIQHTVLQQNPSLKRDTPHTTTKQEWIDSTTRPKWRKGCKGHIQAMKELAQQLGPWMVKWPCVENQTDHKGLWMHTVRDAIRQVYVSKLAQRRPGRFAGLELGFNRSMVYKIWKLRSWNPQEHGVLKTIYAGGVVSPAQKPIKSPNKWTGPDVTKCPWCYAEDTHLKHIYTCQAGNAYDLFPLPAEIKQAAATWPVCLQLACVPPSDFKISHRDLL
jgi:hypothetical protein